MSNSLIPDQVRRYVGLVYGPNRLQRLSADDSISQKVKRQYVLSNLSVSNILDSTMSKMIEFCVHINIEVLSASIDAMIQLIKM